MQTDIKKINRSLMIGWSIICAVLFVAYIGEYLKGARTGSYVLTFLACTILPCLYCIYRYIRKPDSEQLKIYIVIGYFVMYLFSMMTSSTSIVFCYILPMLSLLILYHKPKLILYTGIASVVANIYFIAMQFISGEITLQTSQDAEIQLGLIVLCFGGCYAATRIYDRITLQNELFMVQLEEKSEQNQQMVFQTIMTIVNTIDAKDQYTKGHSQRVSEYSAALAGELGHTDEEVEKIRYIALLHDIGKIGVPDSILNKPGSLTNEEFSLMKMHTVAGGEILKDIGSVEGLDVGAKYHHERYGGGGYPEGLQGEEIPYVARLICVADAYDAMASSRVYRKHLAEDTIMQEMRRCSGTQFDPVMVEAFLRLLQEKRLGANISENNDDSEKNMANRILQKILETTGSFVEVAKDLDILTGLYNKSHGEELLDLYLVNGDGCLLFVDVDSLNRINGEHGLARGDLYLKTVARILDAACENKILYRSDSDEFVCFLCGVVNKDALTQTMNGFYQRLEAEKTNDTALESLTVSIGAVFTEYPKCDKADLFLKVSKALGAAKKSQGNGFCEYHSLLVNNAQKLSKIDLESLLNWLKSDEEYPAAYQVNYPEFIQTIDDIKKIFRQKEHTMHVFMFTAAAADEGNVTIEQRAEVMKLLQKAVEPCLGNNGLTTQFSSSQQIVILMDVEKEYAEETLNHIIHNFYKMNQYNKFSIYHESASL